MLDGHSHKMGKDITNLDGVYHSMDFDESKFNKKEKLLKRDLYDLIEYCKWCTDKITDLRQRVRAAEHVINSLRQAGESSVESLLDTLFLLKKKQEKLDAELGTIRDIVQNKEAQIKNKEDAKGRCKAAIEDENNLHEKDFRVLRAKLDEQKALITN